ncbi:MAG: iron chelate uptake ABC transporter family permease subunit, partial [Solobacterium sp.]|nr:iron chelate uptake ABC transporter family permease subunit [Solobacterium sp.]
MKRYHTLMIAGAAALAVLFLIAVGMGQYRIPVPVILKELLGGGSGVQTVRTTLLQVRIPRILLSMLAGAGLASAGVAFQSLFGNPLATPDTLGIANGASFGAALGLLVGLDAFGVQVLSLACGALAVMLVFLVSRPG